MCEQTIQRDGSLRGFVGRVRDSGLEFVLPMLKRPRHLQSAALCYRREADRTAVLLITSRGTGRWIIPKGWLMRGKNASEAAVVEAWEEAGVRPARAASRPVGSYTYNKIKDSGLPVAVETLVFPLEVDSIEDRFPEVGERERRWVDPEAAADMVAEPGLQQILRDFRHH